jgi:hypothetical protein
MNGKLGANGNGVIGEVLDEEVAALPELLRLFEEARQPGVVAVGPAQSTDTQPALSRPGGAGGGSRRAY